MAENSKIEWTDHTFNPWIGCTAVSAACDICYAQAMVERFGGDFSTRRRTAEENWRKPIIWNRKAAAAGVRAKVFCASMADMFDNQVPAEWRNDLWELIASTPHLDWLLLTKRPQNIAKMLPVMNSREPGYKPWNQRWPWPNVWLGTTVENQEEADRRIPHLLAAPAAVRFLSCEPLLSPVDLTRIDDGSAHREVPIEEWGPVDDDDSPPSLWWDALTGERTIMHGGASGDWSRVDASIDWVICGGESGRGARPMPPDWARSVRDQCDAAGVPFLFKQWGSCVPGDMSGEDERGGPAYILDDDHCTVDYDELGRGSLIAAHGMDFIRFSHKRTGRLLDGRTHDGYPAVRS